MSARRKASGRATVDGETARTPDFASGAKIRRQATPSKAVRQRRLFAVDHRPLSPPVRKPKPPRPEPEPKPAAPPPQPPSPFDAGLERLGPWLLLARDPLGKERSPGVPYAPLFAKFPSPRASSRRAVAAPAALTRRASPPPSPPMLSTALATGTRMVGHDRAWRLVADCRARLHIAILCAHLRRSCAV